MKARGVEGLLDFSTTRPPAGVDHVMQNGIWTPRRPNWFQRHYGVGPLIYNKSLPHLDVAFEAESPYGSYNWELFFHAPLQVAVRLAKEGRHEEAQRWFHFIFDPTTDSSAPSPRRFWRFAPFYENNEYDSARELMQLLSYGGQDAGIIERQNRVRHQLSAWWEKPFSPHVIARLRIAAYQKAVVMKYIDNLVEWGDKLFRRDSMESIQEATQIYILAANILGPRPEKIPPIVSKPPLTFQQMRHGLDLFSNFEVRLENLQVRRPFRINARPDTSAATAVLGMATQYFCTPPNPQLDKYWDTVADRLHKIRNCMNIQGIVRQLAAVRAADRSRPPGAGGGGGRGSRQRDRQPQRAASALPAPLPARPRRPPRGRDPQLRRDDAAGARTPRRGGARSAARVERDHAARRRARHSQEASASSGGGARRARRCSREHVDMQIQHLTAQLRS